MSEADDETWRPVPGFEDLYEVSDKGRVRSVDRTVDTPNDERSSKFCAGRILSTQVNTDQQLQVELSRGGDQFARNVARLVLLAHGPEPASTTMVAKKIDEDGPVSIENLEWRRPIGRQKLADHEALAIWREAWAADDKPSTTNADIGARYGVSRQTVSHIKHGRSWNHVTPDTPPAPDDK